MIKHILHWQKEKIHRLIDNELRNRGLELTRVPRHGAAETDINQNATTIIELAGPSGIGKSSLYRSCLGDLGGRFQKFSDVVDTRELTSDSPALEAYREILRQRLLQLTEGIVDPRKIVRIYSRASQICHFDISARLSKIESDYLFDEGILSNFLEQIIHLDFKAQALLLKNRAAIILTTNDVDQWLERKSVRDGKYTVGRVSAIETLRSYAILGRLLEEHGVLYKKLLIEDGFEANKRGALEFLSGLQCN